MAYVLNESNLQIRKITKHTLGRRVKKVKYEKIKEKNEKIKN